MIKLTIKIFFALTLLFSYSQLLASEDGNYFIKNFSYSDYGGDHQVFESIQDNRGVMYFANSEVGVLEYDGESWRDIKLDNSSSGRCLTKSDDGIIYIGGVGEFGYIKSGEIESEYISLVDKVNKENRDFEYVWECESNKKGVYFNTDKIIYFKNGDTIKTIKTDSKFHILRESNGRIFVRIINKGLFEIDGEILKPLIDGEKFSKHAVNAIIAKDDGSLVVFSRDSGIYNYNGKKFTKLLLKNSEELYKSLIYDAILLDDNIYAIATKNGIFIVKNDEVKQHLYKYLGLINNIVLNLYLDKEKNIWVTTDGGISKINLSNGLSYFDDRQGVENSVNDIKSFNNKLYVATMNGVLVKNGLKFEKIKGLENGVWRLEILNNKLYIGATKGLYTLEENEIIKSDLVQESVVSMIQDSQNILYISQSNKILVVDPSDTENKLITSIDNLENRPTFMLFQNKHLWFTNEKKELFAISFKNGLTKSIKQNFSYFLDKKNKQSFFMRVIDSKLYFFIDDKFYRFNYADEKFEEVLFLDKEIRDLQIKDVITSKDDKWVISGKTLLTSHLKENSLQNYPFSYFKGKKIEVIEKDSDDTIWFGGPEGLISYDQNKKQKQVQNSIIIRKLTLDNYAHSNLINLNYSGNHFFIDVALNSYLLVDENEYSFELNGAYHMKKDYSLNSKFNIYNLPHGDYTLSISARNIFKEKVEKIVYFHVKTPWYYTNIAYIVYLILFLLLIYISGQIQSYYKNIVQQKKLKQEIEQRHLLEQKVKDRTKELHEKNKLLVKLSTTDQLTKLYNRVKLDETFENEINRASRYKKEFSILLIDIDFFKSVNDVFGHQVGDSVLVEFADIMKNSIRKIDILGRWGGEEFLIICPNTASKGAIALAENIRKKIQSHLFAVVGNKTVSIGVSTYMPDDTEEKMVERADKALYSAKNDGRNQVVFIK